MMGWFAFLVWLVGFAWHWRAYALAIAESEYNVSPSYFTDGDRYFAAGIGAIAALFWPVTAPFFHARRLIRRSIVPPSEVVARQEQELKELRRLARQYGLPFPESDREA